MKNQGFKAAYLGIGAHEDAVLGIEGNELAGVYSAIELLKRYKIWAKK